MALPFFTNVVTGVVWLAGREEEFTSQAASGKCTLRVPEVSICQTLRQAQLCVHQALQAEGTIIGLAPLGCLCTAAELTKRAKSGHKH